MDRNIKEFSPIGILNIVGIYSVFQVLTTNYIFTYKQYIGLSLVLICTVLFFINRKAYKYLTALTLITGLIGLIAFSISIITFSISFIQVQLIPLVVLLIYMYIFRFEIRQLFEKTEAEKQNNTENLKNKFRQNFRKLSNTEIENKLNKNLVPEAIEALKEIKTERKLK
jgi:fatty acid desaturase